MVPTWNQRRRLLTPNLSPARGSLTVEGDGSATTSLG